MGFFHSRPTVSNQIYDYVTNYIDTVAKKSLIECKEKCPNKKINFDFSIDYLSRDKVKKYVGGIMNEIVNSNNEELIIETKICSSLNVAYVELIIYDEKNKEKVCTISLWPCDCSSNCDHLDDMV